MKKNSINKRIKVFIFVLLNLSKEFQAFYNCNQFESGHTYLVVMYYTPGHFCKSATGCVVHHYSYPSVQFDENYTLAQLDENYTLVQFDENYTLAQFDENYTLENLMKLYVLFKLMENVRMNHRLCEVYFIDSLP